MFQYANGVHQKLLKKKMYGHIFADKIGQENWRFYFIISSKWIYFRISSAGLDGVFQRQEQFLFEKFEFTFNEIHRNLHDFITFWHALKSWNRIEPFRLKNSFKLDWWFTKLCIKAMKSALPMKTTYLQDYTVKIS